MNALRALPKDKLQKIALAAILSVIGVGAVGYFYVGAQFSALSASKREVADFRQKIEAMESASKQAACDERLREQVVAFAEEQKAAMVSGDPFGWVVRQLSELAERHPIRLLGMRPGAKAQHGRKSRYEIYTTRIEIEGSYDQLGAFVADFENQFPAAEIRSLELTPNDATRPVRRATMELALLILPGSDKPATAAKKDAPKETS